MILFILIFSGTISSSLVTCSMVDSPAPELQLVQVIFRHGDRNIYDNSRSFPDDPYTNESYWPEGFAQLTKRGKQQQYELGQWLRKRYSSYLPGKYSSDDIFVQSSDVDRAIMSVQANLAGLYPPNAIIDPSSMWNEDIHWQPIPVHTIPKALDNKLLLSQSCPKADHLIKEVYDSPEMAQIYSENKELFQHFQNFTKTQIRTLPDLTFLYDTLLIKSIRNYTLPAWSQGYFPGGQLHNLTCIGFKVKTWTNKLKRLNGGPLIAEIIENFKEVIEKKNKMFFMYSGHDITLVTLMNSLGIWDGLDPGYASAVIFELWKRNGTSFVEIYYRNDAPKNPSLLKIPGCKQSCPIDSFIELTDSIISRDWRKECDEI